MFWRLSILPQVAWQVASVAVFSIMVDLAA